MTRRMGATDADQVASKLPEDTVSNDLLSHSVTVNSPHIRGERECETCSVESTARIPKPPRGLGGDGGYRDWSLALMLSTREAVSLLCRIS